MGFEISGLLSNIDKGPFTLFVPTDRAFNEYLLNVMGGVSKGLARMERNKSELYQVCYILANQLRCVAKCRKFKVTERKV